MVKSKDILVGKWFHSMTAADPRTVEWQGRIKARVNETLYLVEIYEWITGVDVTQHLVDVNKMLAWRFYDSDVQMRDWYDRVYAPRRARKS